MAETYTVEFEPRDKSQRAEMTAEAAAQLVAEGKMSAEDTVTDVTARASRNRFKAIKITVA